MWSIVMMTLLLMFGVMMIGIILLQRGRGGGLAGAFGGAGGQSALGTKAGDVFTKITVVMAVIWVILAGVSGIVLEKSRTIYAAPEKTEIGPPPGDETDSTGAKGDNRNNNPPMDLGDGKGGSGKPTGTDKKGDGSKADDKKDGEETDGNKADSGKADGKKSDADNKEGADSAKAGKSTGAGSDASDKKKTPETGEKNK